MTYDRAAPRRSDPLKVLVQVYVFRGKRLKRITPDYFHLHDRNKAENLFDYFKWLVRNDRWIRRIEFRLDEEYKAGRGALWVLDAGECLSAWWAAELAADFFDVITRSSMLLDLSGILGESQR